MSCCLNMIFILVIVCFVQVRLRQARDSMKVPLKWGVTYNGTGVSLEAGESCMMRMGDQHLLYGHPPVTNLTFTKGSCYVRSVVHVYGTPLSFHRLRMMLNDYVFREDSVMTDMNGHAYSEMTDEFPCRKIQWKMQHVYDHNMNQNGKASADINVLFRNGIQ